MPRAHVRLSAGRSEMSDELQALCFMAGANSIFYGEKLLTTGNPDTAHDRRLFERLNIIAEPASDAQAAAFVGAELAPLAEPAGYHSATA
jgi:biotin synthase